MAVSQPSPDGLSIGNGYVYWTTGFGSQDVLRCPNDGCGAGPTIIATGETNVASIASTPDEVYWTTASAIMGCDQLGCNQTPFTFLSDTGGPFGLATDGSVIYWTDRLEGAPPKPGAVLKCPAGRTCNSTVLIAKDQTFPNYMAVNSSSIFWLADGVVAAADK